MAIIRYPGGKYKLKSIILKHLIEMYEDGLSYIEPFFGGGSIGLEFVKLIPTSSHLYFNDKDIGMYCLWKSVILYPDRLCQKIKEFIPTTDAFHNFKKELLHLSEIPTTPTAILDRGFMKLAIHQISFSGLGTMSGGPLGGDSQKSKYKIDCRWSPENICKKINEIHYQLKPYTVHLECGDFQPLLNCSRSLIYLDPPYFVKGNDLYQCGFSIQDHERLRDTLKRTNHKWILSYDDSPIIREFYSWANIHTIDDVSYTIKTSRQKSELIITSK